MIAHLVASITEIHVPLELQLNVFAIIASILLFQKF